MLDPLFDGIDGFAQLLLVERVDLGLDIFTGIFFKSITEILRCIDVWDLDEQFEDLRT